MAYNSLNKLLQIEEAQEIWASFQEEERATAWIFKNHIKDKFRISMRTFENWLGRNVKKEMRQLEEKGIVISR